MQKELQKLGFTPNETAIYLILLELGQSSTGPIIKKTGPHRNIVYDTLDNLVKKKLVAETIKSNKKYFQLRNPQTLVDKAREQLYASNKLAERIAKKLKTDVPEVIMYEGSDGWQTAYRLLANRLKQNDAICALGVGGDKWIEAMGDFFMKWENFLKDKKITNKMIAYDWQKEEILAHQKNPMRKTKYLSEDHLILANTEIFKDGIFIQIYTDPLALIEIRSAEVAKGYAQHFESLWKLARE